MDGCCGNFGAEEDDAAEDAGVNAERLFPIPFGTGPKVTAVVGEMSSLLFLRPPKTRFNLNPALPEDTGTVGDGGGGSAGSDGDRDWSWPIVGRREEERGTGRMVSEGR